MKVKIKMKMETPGNIAVLLQQGQRQLSLDFTWDKDNGHWISFRIQDFGFWILHLGLMMLDFWILDKQFEIAV